MAKVTFIGAGSVIFAKQVMADILSFSELQDITFSLMDIDAERLRVAELMAKQFSRRIGGRAKIETTMDRRTALKDADYVIHAIQVGGHEATLFDFDIPRKYGLKQTIADTLGVGGVFRGLRTIPPLLDLLRDMEEICPDAYLLNYSNPMAILSLAALKSSGIKYVGLCHSVQQTSEKLAEYISVPYSEINYVVAGINHMAWFLKLEHKGKDLYPQLFDCLDKPEIYGDNKVRFEIMRHFGYFVTESSEHMAEYVPYFIKREELIGKLDIPIDEYVRRSVRNIGRFEDTKATLESGKDLETKLSHEYAAYIIHSLETGYERSFNGNVINNGLIENLPADSCVEVPCLVNKNGFQPVAVGKLPTQLAALNQTNISVQQLAVEGALKGKKEYIYNAVMMDPHTSSVLTLDEIRNMTDELFEAHAHLLPAFK
ncbi:alpha-glucosidase/alpha-galactosidase [Ruminiclostridium cellobioparum]|uniref:Glycoside hydrolase family protein n=1 Tax=Ruminiclostridium cellobioparum subsp. termitidis CT1112 TaxID=1195236 RepID=S0FHL3_RUMCE|nr:alpha-glucosidase/alpha-galactosidase [Ruminiclostridium cellobioparum]EMS69391.1 glycoside hydrolase family protein [Ruminiclostridium cellobioparum subsp. termitidis CT1112]